MREEVLTAIRATYPERSYRRRDGSKLDRAVSENEVQSLADSIRERAVGEVSLQREPDYDVCYRLAIAHPDKRTVSSLQKKQSKKEPRPTAESAYVTFMLVSRVGRFYTVHWNAIVPMDRTVQTEFRSEPPTKELQDFASWLHSFMRKRRFSALDRSDPSSTV